MKFNWKGLIVAPLVVPFLFSLACLISIESKIWFLNSLLFFSSAAFSRMARRFPSSCPEIIFELDRHQVLGIKGYTLVGLEETWIAGRSSGGAG
jgi:hypothetical protein